MNYIVLTYILYLLIILYVIIYIGAVFYRNGEPFLIQTFKGDKAIATAVNKFLLVAYYLFNIGYSILALKVKIAVTDWQQMLEVLSAKAGTIILILGIAHYFNILTLICIGKVRKEHTNIINPKS
jgi:hypothetical protein